MKFLKFIPPLGEGGAERRERVRLGAKSGFSLIELMISLIAISLITAAFAPVISKRLSSSEFTIGVGSGGGSSANMADWVTDCSHVNANCMYCLPSGNCQMCDLNCGIKYKNVEKCICEECNTKFDNCSECNRAECSKCSEGYYVLNGECNKTHAGSYSPDGINEETCPKGYYCEEGKSPIACPSGKYSESGAKSASECVACEAGYACQNGVRSECSAGQYSKSGATTCTNCDSYNSSNSAYYNETSKSNTCTICEAGNMCTGGSKTQCDNPTYATQGSTYCSDCTNCTECDNKTGNCTKCEEGFYILNNKCVPCTTGYYCPGGSDSTRHECPSSCSSCTSQTNCTGCRATYQLDNSGSCNPCPEGYYCSGGVASAEGCVNSCKSCSNTSTCNTCNNGYYINNSSTCTQCEEGYMCPNGQTRTSCDAGKYQNEKGQTSCKTCSSATGTANTICGCNAGYYMNNGTCTSCNGFYQPNDGYTGTSCGTVCAAGYYGKDGTCTPCYANQYNALTGQTEYSACMSCYAKFGAGYGSDVGSSTCVKCSSNCSTCSNSSTCRLCNEGYMPSSSTGQCITEANQCGTSSATGLITCNYMGLSVYKHNVGDTYGPLSSKSLLESAGISVCSVGVTCAYGGKTPTCYQGVTAQNSGTYACTTYGSYSGCNRTVCNWFGANKACTSIGWRLPTFAESAESWGPAFSQVSSGKGSYGIGLCGRWDCSTGLMAMCTMGSGCGMSGNSSGTCEPSYVWTSTATEGQDDMWSPAYEYSKNSFYGCPGSGCSGQGYIPKSVRCVKD